MKKKMIVLLAVLIMVFSMSFASYAADSPEGKPTQEEEAKKSPKTGEYDVLYALVGVALLTGVLVISRKHLAALKE